MRALLLVLVTGCQSLLGFEEPPNDRCTTWTFTPNEFDPCAIPTGTDDVVLTGFEATYLLDGDTGNLSFQDSQIVYSLPRISLDGRSIVSANRWVIERDVFLDVNGVQPVVLVAWDDFSIRGGLTSAPGANDPSCAGVEVGSLGGGSGGGGFRAAGGPGGNGPSGPGGAGGAPRAFPERLAGGCAGAPSADGLAAGYGGGALALIARTDLVIFDGGNIAANGGEAAVSFDGSMGNAGGGSGGMLQFEATRLVFSDNGSISACGRAGGLLPLPPALECLMMGSPGMDASSSARGGGGGGSGGHIVYRAHPGVEIGSDFLATPGLQPF